MGKEEDKKDDDSEKTKESFIAKTSGKVSEFFNHMIAYGGFTFEDGVMRIWGDPSLFIPMEAFVTLFYEVEQKLGKKDAHDLFYWLGRLYGKNSSEMLLLRYGLNKKDLDLFVNGATQDGMGYLKIQEHDKDFTYGIVIGINSIFAIEYYKKYGKTKEAIDYYLAGILAGGTEPLVDKIVRTTERECMATGNDQCLYYLDILKEKPK